MVLSHFMDLIRIIVLKLKTNSLISALLVVSVLFFFFSFFFVVHAVVRKDL